MSTRKNILNGILVCGLALAVGCSSDSNTTAAPVDTVPPAIPDGVGGWMTRGGDVEVAWEANVTDPDLAGYVVQRSVNGQSWEDTRQGLVTSNSWRDGSVQAGNSYSYRVSAVDASGNASGYSATWQVEPVSSEPTISDGTEG